MLSLQEAPQLCLAQWCSFWIKKTNELSGIHGRRSCTQEQADSGAGWVQDMHWMDTQQRNLQSMQQKAVRHYHSRRHCNEWHHRSLHPAKLIRWHAEASIVNTNMQQGLGAGAKVGRREMHRPGELQHSKQRKLAWSPCEQLLVRIRLAPRGSQHERQDQQGRWARAKGGRRGNQRQRTLQHSK